MVVSFGDFLELDEAVSPRQSRELEHYLQSVFQDLGLSLAFSKHFTDCMNVSPDVSMAELRSTFRTCVRKYHKELSVLKDKENGYFIEQSTKLNVPFTIHRSGNRVELIAVNAMKGNKRLKGREFRS